MANILGTLGLGILLNYTDNASRGMAKTQASFNQLDQQTDKTIARFDKIKKAAAVGGVLATFGAGLVGGMVGAANSAGELEFQLTAVGAVTRATSEEMAMLKDRALDLGVLTEFSPDQTVEGMRALATAGFQVGEIMDSIRPVLDLATGSMGQLGVAGAAEVASGALRAFAMDTSQTGAVVDKLLRITQLTNLQARDFETVIGLSAAQVKLFGGNLDDALISLGILKNAANGASVSATALRNVIRRLVDKDVQALVKSQFGVPVIDEATGGFRNMIDIITDVSKSSQQMIREGVRTEAEVASLLQDAFQVRAMNLFNAVANASFKTMKDGKEVTLGLEAAIAHMRGEMGNAGGTAEFFANQLKSTWQGILNLIRGTVQTMVIVLGDTVLPFFKGVVSAANEILVAVLKWMKTHPVLLKTIGIVTVFVGVVSLLAGAFFLASTAGAFLVATLAPFLPIILGIGAALTAVIGLGIVFKNEFENLGFIIKAVFGLLSAGEIDEGLFNILKDAGLTKMVAKTAIVLEKILGVFKFLGRAADEFTTGLAEGFGFVMPEIQALWQMITQGFEVVFDNLAELGGFWADVFGRGEDEAFSFLRVLGQVIGWFVGTMVKGILGAIAIFTMFGEAITGLIEPLTAVGNIIVDVLGGAMDFVIEKLGKMVGFITKLNVGGRISSAIGGLFGFGDDAEAERVAAGGTTVATPVQPASVTEPLVRGSLAAQSAGLQQTINNNQASPVVNNQNDQQINVSVQVGDEPVRALIRRDQRESRARNFQGNVSNFRGVPSYAT